MPLHLGVTIGLLGGASAAFVTFLPSGRLPWTAWVAAVAAIILSDFMEYVLHRWPMHRRRRLTRAFFRHHTIAHHRYFTYETMGLQSFGEASFVVSSPPVLVASMAFLGGITALMCAMLGAHAGLFAGAVLGLFGVAKQILHLAFHLPDKWMRYPVLRSRIFQALKEHHAIHHDPRLMRRWNFSIGTPLFDALFGTLTWERSEQKSGPT